MSNAMTKQGNERQLTKQQQQFKTIRDYLLTRKGALSNVIPKYLDSERMVRLALGAASRNPKLLECTPESWLAALMDCAFYGLEPNPALGHAYLVPFKNKNKGGVREVQFIPGYKGLILLAKKSKAFSNVDAGIVYENEYKQGRFVETPHDPVTPFRHEPLYGKERGAQFGFYAVGWISPKDRPAFRFCTMEEIRETRKRARAADSGPWCTDFTAMAKKTAVRRLMALAPIEPDSPLDTALNHERVLQQGQAAHAQDWSHVIAGGPRSELPAAKTESGTTETGEVFDSETGEVLDQAVLF